VTEIGAITWTEVGIFWTSVVLAIITVSATLINYLFFRSQIDPDVIVYVTPDEDRPSIILLIIENIGRGLAKDVSFSMDKKLPERAFGFKNAQSPKEMKSGPLFSGIPALGPRSKRTITWGQYGGLSKGISDDTINIKVKFKSKRSIYPSYKWHTNVCPVDIKSFEGTDVSDTNWNKKIFQQLERIATALEK
jgi:hypothetical protein